MKDRIESTHDKVMSHRHDLTDKEFDRLRQAMQLAVAAAEMFAGLASDAVCRINARKRKESR